MPMRLRELPHVTCLSVSVITAHYLCAVVTDDWLIKKRTSLIEHSSYPTYQCTCMDNVLILGRGGYTWSLWKYEWVLQLKTTPKKPYCFCNWLVSLSCSAVRQSPTTAVEDSRDSGPVPQAEMLVTFWHAVSE